ncbi:uncharacterized protein [Antedon mediterranea]|uniref:uncharacterized protein n=1 Tax=Antedon mediterranea TaxID=105859 RepID=UPI003AF7347F
MMDNCTTSDHVTVEEELFLLQVEDFPPLGKPTATRKSPPSPTGLEEDDVAMEVGDLDPPVVEGRETPEVLAGSPERPKSPSIFRKELLPAAPAVKVWRTPGSKESDFACRDVRLVGTATSAVPPSAGAVPKVKSQGRADKQSKDNKRPHPEGGQRESGKRSRRAFLCPVAGCGRVPENPKQHLTHHIPPFMTETSPEVSSTTSSRRWSFIQELVKLVPECGGSVTKAVALFNAEGRIQPGFFFTKSLRKMMESMGEAAGLEMPESNTLSPLVSPLGLLHTRCLLFLVARATRDNKGAFVELCQRYGRPTSAEPRRRRFPKPTGPLRQRTGPSSRQARWQPNVENNIHSPTPLLCQLRRADRVALRSAFNANREVVERLAQPGSGQLRAAAVRMLEGFLENLHFHAQFAYE